jgi:hypothetical protein
LCAPYKLAVLGGAEVLGTKYEGLVTRAFLKPFALILLLPIAAESQTRITGFDTVKFPEIQKNVF